MFASRNFMKAPAILVRLIARSICFSVRVQCSTVAVYTWQGVRGSVRLGLFPAWCALYMVCTNPSSQAQQLCAAFAETRRMNGNERSMRATDCPVLDWLRPSEAAPPHNHLPGAHHQCNPTHAWSMGVRCLLRVSVPPPPPQPTTTNFSFANCYRTWPRAVCYHSTTSPDIKCHTFCYSHCLLSVSASWALGARARGAWHDP
ncbi:hypothetical protein V8E53_007080 [Lactarius tabidus]